YLFPVITPRGNVDFTKRMPASSWQVIWDRILDQSGLARAYPNGNFTGHCFRRGAAQWRFSFDPAGRWSFTSLTWWGGWVEGESVS
ncbi:hypothetical protein HD553DRAFT_258793, partial [Filobasidium floriforme]|uniref:uncharacterized protein n=1 Tax=Filobasidium floriforme TaxID=5210 RepID=UPI001E8D300B